MLMPQALTECAPDNVFIDENKPSLNDIPVLLRRWQDENDQEAGNLLFTLLLPELKKMAHRLLRSYRHSPIRTETLAQELATRFIKTKSFEAETRAAFFGYVTQAMRHLILDSLKSRHRIARGGEKEHVPLDELTEEIALISEATCEELIDLDEAMQALRKDNLRLAETFELRHYRGFTNDEIEEMQGRSISTVKRDLSQAKCWLFQYLTQQTQGVGNAPLKQ
ncbi:MAG: sigma-70 family RNA polymerase sigma factor [Acidobacteria bacterium]|nr:sigma-70 family RNA polymerase sigma factor [Acidobacteriota bacterium]